MLPKLRDVVSGVLEAGDGMTQTQLAVALFGTPTRQGKISDMLSCNDDSDWEKHWQACARLIPIAIDLDVLKENDLMEVHARNGHKKGNAHSSTGRSKTR